jgi:hypothetical protein
MLAQLILVALHQFYEFIDAISLKLHIKALDLEIAKAEDCVTFE